MAASSTTRRGNGAGWGGERKGEGHKFTAGDPMAGRPEGLATGEGKAARAKQKAADAAEDAIDTVIAIAKDRTDQRALAAAFGILNRVGLHEKAETTVHQTGYVIAAPPEAEDAEDWAKQHRPH